MKKQKPLVSVIMSEYNTDQKLLINSINSILNQTYENIEFIIIDDCGKNDLKKILSNINDKRIVYYKNEKNSGLVYSLNKAISISKGKYIARMDTDDFSYPNRLEIEVEYLEKNPQIDLVSSRADYFDGKVIWGESKFSGNVRRKELLNGSPIIHPTVMFKKETLQKIGGYLNYNRCEDYATWIELFVNNFNLYVLDEKTIKYHLSIEDYKKRTLKTRKGFFKMLSEEYIKLNPSKTQLFKIRLKTFIAGILPWKLMYFYHKRKAR